MSNAQRITEAPSTPTALRRIHVIFKTHLDVGFTDFASSVLHNYLHSYIPKALYLAEQMRQQDPRDRFLWTTGSWLIAAYLEQAEPAERLRMEQAITAGDITWHALPCTLHSENMDVDLFRFGLSISQGLDQRFGKHTIAAKMTDVPGHTRGIVPLLAAAGVQFLHLGVNEASTPPDVPPVFRWRDPSQNAEVMVMYHKQGYGDLMLIPGLEDAIAFAHTGDNLGPQSIEELQATYRALRARFPGVDIFASTMDAFAEKLTAIREQLPVITQEIGDTWIHGIGSDPKKEAQYRELLRFRREEIAAGADPADWRAFQKALLLIPEHTWGLDVKTHLHDWTHYSAADFQSARQQPNFQKMEASWQEQRDYVKQAVEALPPAWQTQARQRLEAIEPAMPNRRDFTPMADRQSMIHLPHFQIAFDPHLGCLTQCTADGVEYATPQTPLGKFWYETFSADDYARFHRQYNVNKRTTRLWSIPDFTKPGIETASPTHQTFLPNLTWAGRSSEARQERFLFLLEMPTESVQSYGAPRTVTIQVTFPNDEPTMHWDVQWFEKSACRLPEAAWFSFMPQVKDPHRWQMNKLGEWISPDNVIRDGNRHLHAVGEGARNIGPRHQISIQSLDAPLLAPGSPSLLNFTNQQPNLRKGLHFNLFNNLWGTNFRMWYEENARFRFTLKIEPKASGR